MIRSTSLTIFLLLFAVSLCAQAGTEPADAPAAAAQLRYSAGGFLYLEDHRVRYEILVPLRDLASIYPVDAEDGRWTPELQRAHRPAIAAILEGTMALAINGRPATPVQSSLVFLDLRAPMENTATQGATYDADTGAVGIILHYTPPLGPPSGPPSGRAYEVDAAWSGFNPVIQQLPVRVFSRKDEATRVLTQRQNRLLAHHAGTDDPQARTGSAIEARGPLDNAERATKVLHDILRNIYGAFDYSRDEDIYDALERTITGELLSRIYLDIRASLYMEQEGGATARVDEIRVTDVTILESTPARTTLQATWHITGTLEHWGHIHQRTNEYSARIVIGDEGGHHKMAELRIERHRRIADEFTERSSAP